MTPFETAYLGGAIFAFLAFAAVLGWAAHIDYKRNPPPAAGED